MSSPCVDAKRLLIAHAKAMMLRWVTAPYRWWLWAVEAWPTIRKWIIVVMLVLFALGSAALWAGSIYSLIATGGFAGITCWQGMGIWYLFFANYTTGRRLKERNSFGEYELDDTFMRKRLRASWHIVTMNIVGNSIAIALIAWNLHTGRLQWTMWDRRAFIFAGVVIAVIFLVGEIIEKSMLKNSWAVFFLVLATRIVPQSFLGLSPSLALINWWVLGGLGAVAFQRFVISGIEFVEAIAARKSEENRTRAGVLALGDTLNFGAALIPILLKAARF